MRDIVKVVSKKGSRCQNTVVNRGGVRERYRQIERWLRERETGELMPDG